MPDPGKISIKIYNLLGEEIFTLFKGSLDTGRHLFTWNGTNIKGQKCPSGVYIYQVTAQNGFKASNKMILMK
ncbi:MAG: FlgD immunoglobulin-like domain containing protein [Calditrichaceae bacterium]